MKSHKNLHVKYILLETTLIHLHVCISVGILLLRFSNPCDNRISAFIAWNLIKNIQLMKLIYVEESFVMANNILVLPRNSFLKDTVKWHK